jgi:hypothetical protein
MLWQIAVVNRPCHPHVTLLLLRVGDGREGRHRQTG